jgi:hypothetical protein
MHALAWFAATVKQKSSRRNQSDDAPMLASTQLSAPGTRRHVQTSPKGSVFAIELSEIGRVPLQRLAHMVVFIG